MAEQLSKDTFLQKIFNYEQNKEWKYQGEIPAVIDFLHHGAGLVVW